MCSITIISHFLPVVNIFSKILFIYLPKCRKNEIKNQLVILSEEKRLRFAESNFCGLSVSERAEARCVAPQGYGSNFRWLVKGMLHLPQKATETPNHIPSSHSLLGFASDRRRERLTPSTKLRLRKTQAFFSAQNDIQWFCWSICVCFYGMPRTSSPTTDFKIHRRGDSRIARFCLRYAFVFAGRCPRRPPLTIIVKQQKTAAPALWQVPRYVIFKQAWFSCFLFLLQAVCRLHQIAFFQARCSGCKGILQSRRGSYI